MSTSRIPKNKGTTGKYFTSETQDWVIKYINEEDELKRNIIFSRYLYKPMKKIVEIYFNKVSHPYSRMYYSDTELKNDCLAHIATNLDGFKNSKGKAFSYISISARNYFIQLNDKMYVAYKKHSVIGDEDGNVIDENYETYEYNTEYKKMYYSFIDYITENIDNIGLDARNKKHILPVLDFMDNFDEVDKYYTLYVTNKFLAKYNVNKLHWGKGRRILASLWESWKQNWNGIDGGKPKYKLGSCARSVDRKTVDWIKSYYKYGSHKYGATSISKKLGITVEAVYDILKGEGIL